ncbi:hypothetical protein FOC36_14350 [Enterococcus gallinarum]|uniref:hypothetical protein n=1 Tax=Enterococcus gallinarum TaxID=1353 RepID=UPI0012DBEF3D|nr:hypothetical protein [Enterococcus gallinarum]QGR83285.1 hypothetical protein FOC36_14350 [Enterococcus gallinarum]
MTDYVLFSLSDLLDNYDEGEIIEKFQTFQCKKETDLEKFLKEKACTYETSNIGRTFIFLNKELLNEGTFDVMAFFTTSQTSYDISRMTQKRKRKVLGSAVPGRDSLNSFPAFLIGQIGRNDCYTSEQLPGHKILHECYMQLKKVSEIIGGEHVILECREPMFERFYRNQGFKKIVTEPDDKGLLTLYNRIKFKSLVKDPNEK